MKIGYSRVSTSDQHPEAQADRLARADDSFFLEMEELVSDGVLADSAVQGRTAYARGLRRFQIPLAMTQ